MELEKQNNGIAKAGFQGLEKFTARLHSAPENSSIKINGMAKNSKYLPISHIQMTLDELFMGLWNWEMKQFQVVANEIVGLGVLEYYHPVANIWLKRSGSGAVMIQQKSESEITDIGAKIKNTLVKDFPHLESECLKSAAKKIGKIFGRDLNREFDDNYQPIYTQESELGEELPEIKKKISNCKSKDEVIALAELFKDHPAAQLLRPLFVAKNQELKIKK